MIKPLLKAIPDSRVNVDDQEKTLSIVAASPVSMNIISKKADDDNFNKYLTAARVTWLCKSNDSSLFCLTTMYAAEYESDIEFLVQLPFSSDKYYINYLSSSNILMSSLPHYMTDFVFEYGNNIHNETRSAIKCIAYDKMDIIDSNFNKISIYVTPNVFATLSYVDKYIINAKYNNADLYTALSYGANESLNPSIFITNMVNVLKIAPLNNKLGKTSLIAFIADFSHHEEGKITQSKKVMGMFNLEQYYKLASRITRKTSFDSLFDQYKEDTECYSQRFIFNDNDNYYIMGSKDNAEVIVQLNKEMQSNLLEQIEMLITNR